MIVNDLLDKTDDELVTMIKEIGNEPIYWTPVILSELSRRGLLRLGESTARLNASSERLEKLTKCLIGLTIVLLLLALPPVLDIFFKRREATQSKPLSQTSAAVVQTTVSSPAKTANADLKGLNNADLFFLLGVDTSQPHPNVDNAFKTMETRRRFKLGELPPHTSATVGVVFRAAGNAWQVSRVLSDGSVAADEVRVSPPPS